MYLCNQKLDGCREAGIGMFCGEDIEFLVNFLN